MENSGAPGGTKGPRDSGGREETIRSALVQLLHPIPLTVLVILVGVTLLIAAAVLGWDNGNVLSKMATSQFARGLITYLFAVTTIGTSVVLVLAALLKEITEDSFQRGKEVLGLLLGVFGTIVGFYFGSEAGTANATALTLASAYVTEASVAEADTVTVVSAVRGGRPPYSFAIGPTADALEFLKTVRQDGLITARFVTPEVDSVTEVPIFLGVRDGGNEVVVVETSVSVRPAGGGS